MGNEVEENNENRKNQRELADKIDLSCRCNSMWIFIAEKSDKIIANEDRIGIFRCILADIEFY